MFLTVNLSEVIKLITEATLSFVSFLLETILRTVSVPVTGNLQVPPDAFDALKKILANVGYILPVEHFLVMLSAYAILEILGFSFSFVELIRRWLPF